MQSQLRVAARLHAQDMGEHAFVDHVNPQGLTAFDRMHVNPSTDVRQYPGSPFTTAGCFCRAG